jgi:hypothetical protein
MLLELYVAAEMIVPPLQPPRAFVVRKSSGQAIRRDAVHQLRPKPCAVVMPKPSSGQPEQLPVAIRVRPAELGMTAEKAKALHDALAGDTSVTSRIRFDSQQPELAVGQNARGQFVILDADSSIRNTLNSEADVAQALRNHAEQRALLSLRGSAKDNSSLSIQIVSLPATYHNCRPAWLTEQWSVTGARLLANCTLWQVRVLLTPSAKLTMRLHAALLAADGQVNALVEDGQAVAISPGKNVTLKKTFVAGEPFDLEDTVVVYGTDTAQSESVINSRMTDPTYVPAGALARAVARIRVQERLDFADPARPGGSLREYTIRGFDISPYLPTDMNGALHRVLALANALVDSSDLGHVKYNGERGWDPTLSDKQNLQAGIDCSTAIWYVFTRAGLSYVPGNRKIGTGDMVADASPLSANFSRCSLEQLRRGDVLVYRNDVQKGHVVLVIVPERRIAWGSHGWDGSTALLKQEKALTGVEYQFIKSPRDWDKWDKDNMRAVACWRYKGF